MAEYSEIIPAEPGYYVYRLWDADGACLYVGRIGDSGPAYVKRRFKQHRYDKPWWPEVARIDIATLVGHSEIITEERHQIHEFHPLHNKVLLDRCVRGHDVSQPESRDGAGACKQCTWEHNHSPARRQQNQAYKLSAKGRAKVAAWRATAEGRSSQAAAGRRWRAKQRGPAEGQGALW